MRLFPIFVQATLLAVLLVSCLPAAEAPDYRYDITLQLPKFDKKHPPMAEMRLELDAERVEPGLFKLRPRIHIELDTPCRDHWTALVPGGSKGKWEKKFQLNCGEVLPSSVQDSRPWLLEVQDHAGKRLHGAEIEARVKMESLNVERNQERGRKFDLKGQFTLDAMEVRVGGRQTVLRWGQGVKGVSTHRLIASLPAPSLADVPVKEPPVEDTYGDPATTTPESTTEDSKEPTHLILDGHGRGAPPTWPELQLWFLDSESGAWIEHVEKRRKSSTQNLIRIGIPEALQGKEFHLQILALGPSGSFPLEFSIHNETAARLWFPKGIQDPPRLHLLWPERSLRKVSVYVTDPEDRPLADAVVTLTLIPTKQGYPFERSSSLTDGQGQAVVELKPDGRDLLVVCALQGYQASTESMRWPVQQVHCSLDRQPVQPQSSMVWLQGKIVDAHDGQPIPEATVKATPEDGQTAMPSIQTGPSGTWSVPASSGAAVHLEVSAPCYELLRTTVEPPLAEPLRLLYQCRPVAFSLLLRRAGGGSVKNARDAFGSIHQGESSYPLRFSIDGFSKANSVLIRPDAGPVTLKVRAPGFETYHEELGSPQEILSALPDGTHQLPDQKIFLRPSDKGVAMLINAATGWPAFPKALAALSRTFDARRGTEATDRWLLGAVRNPKPVHRRDLDGEGGAAVASWLAGIVGDGGQLPPDQLPKWLDRLSDHWLQAASWQLVLVVPHISWSLELDDKALNRERQAMKELGQRLAKQGVTLYVVELGGTHPSLKVLAQASGGRHVIANLTDDAGQTIELVRTALDSIFDSPKNLLKQGEQIP